MELRLSELKSVLCMVTVMGNQHIRIHWKPQNLTILLRTTYVAVCQLGYKIAEGI